MKFTRQKITKEKYFGVAAVFNRLYRFKNIVVQALANKVYRQKHRRHQKQRLQSYR